jgi:hypothetical protein
MLISRRVFLAGGLTLFAGFGRAAWAAGKPTVTVHKSPT